MLAKGTLSFYLKTEGVPASKTLYPVTVLDHCYKPSETYYTCLSIDIF
jgi:hypothetical protein